MLQRLCARPVHRSLSSLTTAFRALSTARTLHVTMAPRAKRAVVAEGGEELAVEAPPKRARKQGQPASDSESDAPPKAKAKAKAATKPRAKKAAAVKGEGDAEAPPKRAKASTLPLLPTGTKYDEETMRAPRVEGPAKVIMTWNVAGEGLDGRGSCDKGRVTRGRGECWRC